MNATTKGIIGVILGILGLFSAVWINFFHIHVTVLIAGIVPLLISICATYFGIRARKSGSQILGITGLLLGVIGILSHSLSLVGLY